MCVQGTGLSLKHDERDYLKPLVHLNEIMSGEEGGAASALIYSINQSRLVGVKNHGQGPNLPHPHNTLMDWLKVHLVKWP